MPRPSVDEVLECLRGNKDSFREILTNKDELLKQLCRYAEIEATKKGCEPWSILGNILGHGSGVSSAIYELYRSYDT